MARTMRFADPETRRRLYSEAERQANANQTQPMCGTCDRVMFKDNFNGMWYCPVDTHGGYQTRSQVASLIYRQLLKNEGYDA